MSRKQHEILAEKLGIKYYFSWQYNLFFGISIDLSSKENTLRHIWIVISTGLSMVALNVFMVQFSWIHKREVALVSDALAPVIQCILAYWKIFSFLHKRTEIMDLIYQIWQITGEAIVKDFEIIVKEAKKEFRLTFIYSSIVFLTATSAIVPPLLISFIDFLSKGEFSYKPPFAAIYPMSIENPKNYILLYTWCCFAAYFAVCTTVGIDGLYAFCVNSIAAQFHVVQGKFKILPKTEGPIKDQIIQCIKYHQKIIALAEKLNLIFRPIVFVEFSVTSLQLCFIAYQMGLMESFERMLFLSSFMTMMLLQLMLYCYSGQNLEDKSNKVCDVAYDCLNWTSWSNVERKLIMLAMLRAQKSCKMDAIFFYANTRLFIWVLRTAASYVTLLFSVAEK